MDKGLRKSIIRLLEQCTEPQYYDAYSEDIHTVHLLQDGGYLTKRDGSIFYTSLTGREYLYRLKHPIRAWYKGSRFLLFVAIITAATAITGVILQIVI